MLIMIILIMLYITIIMMINILAELMITMLMMMTTLETMMRGVCTVSRFQRAATAHEKDRAGLSMGIQDVLWPYIKFMAIRKGSMPVRYLCGHRTCSVAVEDVLRIKSTLYGKSTWSMVLAHLL